CTGCSVACCANPSMVVVCLPSASPTGSEHERTASPFTCTVQAPHCAMPQPYFVPVRPTCSRNTHNKGGAGPTSTPWAFPLTWKRAILASPVDFSPELTDDLGSPL